MTFCFKTTTALENIYFAFRQKIKASSQSYTLQNGLKDNNVDVLEWLSQSPDLNLIENLWQDMKRALHN